MIKAAAYYLQQLMGTNLCTGGYQSEVNQGQLLFAESVRLVAALILIHWEILAWERRNDWLGREREKKSPGRFNVKRPLNWVGSPGLRAEELVHSDFLLLEDVLPESIGEAPAFSTWSEEVEWFKRFACSERGVDKNGLELVSDGLVKLLRLADVGKFSEALYGWANSIHWTDEFRERNKAFLEKSPK